MPFVPALNMLKRWRLFRALHAILGRRLTWSEYRSLKIDIGIYAVIWDNQRSKDRPGARQRYPRIAGVEFRGRKPKPWPLFADFVWKRWLVLGGSPSAKAYINDVYGESPLLRFALALHRSLSNASSDPSDVAKHIRAAQRRAAQFLPFSKADA